MHAIAKLGVLLAGLILAACSPADDPTPDYRYRLTVEVDTPEGLRTGSSVIEVKQRIVRPGMDPSAWAIDRRIRGEAVAVDLPNGQTLFALLRSEENVEWAESVVSALAPAVDDGAIEPADGDAQEYDGNIVVNANLSEGEPWEGLFDRVLLLEGVVEVPRMWSANATVPERSAYPMLVTFGDVSDPTSVARIDPDDLAASFGEGVSLKRVTVELTDDPVTTGVEGKLRWLNAVGEERATLIRDPPRFLSEANPLDLVGPSDFSTELFK